MALTDKLSNIANAIREKTGKSEEMTLDEMPVEIEGISGGGLDIHGVIEQYRVNAGKSVNAGDFVEFVHKFGAGEFAGGMAELAACKLDNNRILMAYQDTGNSYYGTAVVLTIKEGAINMGEKVIFQNERTEQIHVTALSSNKVFISYVRRPYDSYPMANILIIDETDIAISPSKVQFAETTVASTTSTYGTTHTVLSEEKVILSFTISPGNSTSDYHKFYLLLIEDTIISTITTAEDSSSGSLITSHNYLVKLTEALVLSVFCQTNALKARILSVGDAHLTKGSYYTIGASYSGGNKEIAVERLSDNSAIIIYGDNNNSMAKTARVVKATGTQLTLEDPIVLTGNGYKLYTVQLAENKILLMSYGTAQVLLYDGTALSYGNRTVIFENASGGSVGHCKILIPFSGSSVLAISEIEGIGKYNTLYINGYNISKEVVGGVTVQKANSRLHNVGIAATSGADGEMIDVYTVNTSY